MIFLQYLQGCILLLLCTTLSYGSTLPKDTLNKSCDENHPAFLIDASSHLLKKKQYLFSYNFTNINMQGNRMGTEKITDAKLFEDYMMAPNKMGMQMHMLMLMYGVSNKLTMNMPPPAPAVMSMPGMNMGGTAYMGPEAQYASNIGDSKIIAVYKLLDVNRHQILLNSGFNLPTGSVTEMGPTLQGTNKKLPYNMQTGTGTFGFLPALTYMYKKNRLSYGLNFGGNIKLGTNTEGYAFGNTYFGSAGIGYSWFKWINNSIRIEKLYSGQIQGYDKDIALLMYNDPNSNSLHTGGQWLNFYFGMDLFTNVGAANENRFHFEYGVPVSQNINGPQLATLSMLSIGWFHTIN
jgi:hypothetical protein